MKNGKLTFNDGISGYSEALSFIFTKKLWFYFFFPLVLNLVLFILGFRLVDELSTSINEWVNSFLTDPEGEFGWLISLLNSVIYWVVWLTTKVVFFIIFSYIGGYATMIVLSPILAILSEKTASIITGKKYPFDILQLTRDIVRAILIALRNMLIQLAFLIGFFIISFIPIVGWLISFVGNFLVASYFYGFAFIDYTNERNRLSLKQSIQFVRTNKWFAIGIGTIFALCFMVPLIGGIIASFACIVSVVAATIIIEKAKLKN
ncbi:MAG: hypothetical protein CL838_07270 [Crocinitomicaceae bacterium]|nr:hypothetical protein [Crocinitomicaceae bacterium]|tara:strand:+ start:4044 stop:4829 length:786 start_codon:yes stop_codon:yes gene_type:complete